jgi:hypothetical protein
LPDFTLLFNFFVRVIPKYPNCSTLSEDIFFIFTLWFCPAFWSREQYTGLQVFIVPFRIPFLLKKTFRLAHGRYSHGTRSGSIH